MSLPKSHCFSTDFALQSQINMFDLSLKAIGYRLCVWWQPFSVSRVSSPQPGRVWSARPMPGPPPAAPTEPSEKLSCPEDDYGLVTVSKMYAMLVEHEARLKSHVDQSIERLTQRMNLTESDYPNIMHVPSQNATPRRGGKSTHTSQYKTGVPTYVRKLVEGTLKGSGGLGNSTLRSGTGIANSWSSVEHNLVRRKQLWVWYDICTMIVIFLYACLMGVNLQVTTLRGSEPPWTNQGEARPAGLHYMFLEWGVSQLRWTTTS